MNLIEFTQAGIQGMGVLLLATATSLLQRSNRTHDRIAATHSDLNDTVRDLQEAIRDFRAEITNFRLETLRDAAST